MKEPSTNSAERHDNEKYSKHFTRVPNILFASYKHLSKEEKFLYCTLRQIYWDMKPRFVSLRELSELSEYSIGALSKMLPRLHTCGLIHSEIRKERGRDGKEKGNSKYHITIPDIWELNREFFECSPEKRAQMDPSLKLDPSLKPVHQMNKSETCSPNEQPCSPNDTSLFTKSDKPVHQMNKVSALSEPTKPCDGTPKDSIKDTLKERKKDSKPRFETGPSPSSVSDDSHSPIHSSLSLSPEKPEVVFTPEEDAFFTLCCGHLFQAKRPGKTEKVKEQCGELAPHIKSHEQLTSLIELARKEQNIEDKKPMYLGNLTKALNGWLQVQPKPKKTYADGGKPYSEMTALEQANYNHAKYSAMPPSTIKPSEMFKQKQKEALRKGREEYEAALARGENPY